MRTQILVNHVGFLPKSSKHFVIVNPPAKTFEIVRRSVDPTVVLAGNLKCVSGQLGQAWVGSFSELQEDGNYLICCGDAASRVVTVYSHIYDQPLRTLFNYFPTQRCGDSITGWHAPCHTGDARRVDTNEHVDVTGGWHQSCDLRKWTLGTAFGLLGLSQLGLQVSPAWNREQIADELRWGNQYFHKMVRADGGLMDHVVLPLRWVEERDLYPNDAPAAAAYTTIVGQAMIAEYFRNRDPQYSQKCLYLARRMWQYITGPEYPPKPYEPPVLPKYHEWMPGFFSQNYPSSALDLGDGLYAAVLLYRATGQDELLDTACARASALVDLQVGGDASEDPVAACFRIDQDRSDLVCSYYDGIFGPLGLGEILELKPDHEDARRWMQSIRRIAEQKCLMAERNPWGLIPSYWYAENPGGGRKAGSGFYRYFYRYQGLQAGVNNDILGSALFLLRVHRLTGDRRYFDIACRQIDWVFGCNPFDASTVEGVGRNQPERLINTDEFFPPVPQIPGAVMTGIAGTELDEPAEFAMGVEAEYDMPPTAMLMWVLAELQSTMLREKNGGGR